MIEVCFFSRNGFLTGFELSGHSSYAVRGEDIVCAAVSSAVYMAANTIREILNIESDVSIDEGKGEFRLTLFTTDDRTELIMQGLRLHLTELSEQYDNDIRIRNGG